MKKEFLIKRHIKTEKIKDGLYAYKDEYTIGGKPWKEKQGIAEEENIKKADKMKAVPETDGQGLRYILVHKDNLNTLMEAGVEDEDVKEPYTALTGISASDYICVKTDAEGNIREVIS